MTEKALTVVPAGFRMNAKGDLTKVENIRDSDIAIDDFVVETATAWIELQRLIRDFKLKLFGDVSALLDMIAEKYNAKRGGKKGNVQLIAYNGHYKLLVAVADRIEFGPELQAAQLLITECLQSWSKGSGAEMKTIANSFAVDAHGRVSVGKVLSLRRHKFTDERWLQAMQAIADAIMIMGSKQYIRLYERNDVGTYIAIPLDIAAL